MMIDRAAQTCLIVFALVALAGCGQQDSGPSPQDLLRRQQRQTDAQRFQPKTPQERLTIAQQHFSDGNFLAAQGVLRPLLIAEGDDPQVILLAARCEAAAGDKIAAIKMLDAIDETDTESYADALWLAGQWLTDKNEFDAAQQKLERILELPGDVDRVHHRLAQLLNNQGRRIEAAKHLRALARSGDISEKELFAMNTYGDPFIDLAMPKPDFASKLTAGALTEAKRFRAEGKLLEARALVERLSAAFPDSTAISAFQGRVYADLHDEEKVGQWIANTPDEIDREPEYWYAVGIWLQRQGQHREAVRCFTEAVTRDETDRFSYLALARSLTALGQSEPAQRANERFQSLSEAATIAREIGLQPGSQTTLNRLADILQQLNRPWEAIGWRLVAVRTHGGTESEVKALHQQRDALASEEADLGADRFITCGLDLADWPLPTVDKIRVAVATHSSVDPRRERERPATDVPIVLMDIASEARLNFQYNNGDDPSDDSRLLYQMTGGGIGVIDFDLDGWADLYLTQGGGDAFDPQGSKPNQLARNLAGRRFTDVGELSQTDDLGYGQGVAVADINQDGFADLLVANIGPNVLYLNNGDGTFQRRVLLPSIAEGEWTTSIACGDLSGDHLPEIVEVNYVDDPSAMTIACTPSRDVCNPSVFQPAADNVMQVNADGTITSWTGCQQIDDRPNYGFAAIIANFDHQAGNDLFIANDTKENHLWLSQVSDDGQAHTLAESSQIYGCGTGARGQMNGCMGVAAGDFDRNGKLDLHVTNFWDQPSDLYLQQAAGFFSNRNAASGLYELTRKTVGWGTQSVDFDRDGWLDLAILNGHVTDHRHRGRPFEMTPQLFRGDAKGFHLVPPETNVRDYWSTAALGRTMAILDWNNDTRPDLVTNHLDLPVALLENRTNGGNSVQFDLVGTESERDAIGAEIRLQVGNENWTSWQIGGDGFLCSNQQRIDVGIGSAETIDRVDVIWPSGQTQQFTRLPANHCYLIIEGDEEAYRR